MTRALMRRSLRLAGLTLMGLGLLLALRIVAGKLAGPLLLAQAEREFQRDVGSLVFADWVAPAPPAEQNLALHWLAIARALPADARGELSALLRRVPIGNENAETIRRLSSEVAHHQALLRELRALPTLSRIGAERLGEENGAWGRRNAAFSNPEELMRPARWIEADARVALRRDDRARVLADLRALRWFATVLRRDAGLFPWLLARPVEREVLALSQELLRRDGAQVGSALSGELSALEAGADLRRMLAGEALAGRKLARDEIARKTRGGASGDWTDLFSPYTAAHLEAVRLGRTAFVARAIDIPVARWSPAWLAPVSAPSQLLELVGFWEPGPLLESSVQRMCFRHLREEQQLASARRLGRIAAALAESGIPAGPAIPPPEPFPGAYSTLLWSDEPPRIERQPDSSWVASSPRGAELCRERLPGEPDIPAATRESRALLFRWEIPTRRTGNANPLLPVEGKTNPNLEKEP